MKTKESLVSFQKRIGEKMTAMRKETGATDAELFATKRGISRETYRRLEAGIGNPKLRTLAQTLEAAFDLTIEDFLASLFEKPARRKPSTKK